ncbi:hypothetical protein GMOD_00009859 [Pyrenophora seminiperda CCB06]|uniref:Uncharacterized protein n=1 Tax=Pyrenophora seminiperda CCB06 TaxID=1302712 RepID=A0A3M7MEE8_9PLEO|nr:hypothetical protein GMOD_00009859 [Pyrenophora seminiperda CCB06]
MIISDCGLATMLTDLTLTQLGSASALDKPVYLVPLGELVSASEKKSARAVLVSRVVSQGATKRSKEAMLSLLAISRTSSLL